MSLQTPSPSPSPSCSCNPDLPFSLKHILYHQTTKTPLFIHPACWSDAHLRFLRTIVKILPPHPPPPPAPYTYPGSYLSIQPICRVVTFQSGTANDTHYSNSVQAIVCATISIADDFHNPINQVFPIFQYFRHPFPLKVGPTTTHVTPGMYVEHTGKHRISVPFLAYNDSYHREVEQFQNSWYRRTKEQTQYNIGGNIVTVHPFDVSILLAMAQVQETMLPPQKEYKVFLLYPNATGTHVHLLAAKISAGYLQCLRDPCLPPLCDSLTIAHSSVPISDTRQELEYLVRRILASAPTLPPPPPPPGVRQDPIQSHESTRQSAKRRYNDSPQNEHGNIQRPMGQQPMIWKRIRLDHLKEFGIRSGGPAGSQNQA